MNPDEHNDQVPAMVEVTNISAAAVARPASVSKRSKRRRRLQKIAIWVAVLLVGLAIGVGYDIYQSKADIRSVTKVSNAFMHDLVTNQPQAGYQLTGTKFRQTTSQSQLAAFGNTTNVKVTFQPNQQNSWRVTLINNGSTKAATTEFVVTNPKRKLLITLTLYKEGTTWLVEGIRAERL